MTPSAKSWERLAGYVIEVTRAGIQGLAIESVTIVVHGEAPCTGKIISSSHRIFNDLPGKGKAPAPMPNLRTPQRKALIAH